MAPDVGIDGRGPVPFHVGGKRTTGASGETFEATDPGTGERITAVARPAPEDVDRALEAGESAREGWADTSPAERSRRLFRLAELLRENRDELATLLARDVGKPVHEAEWEVTAAASYTQFGATLANVMDGRTIEVPGDRLDFTSRVPYGVSAQIIPWNYPLAIAMRGAGPALGCGNAVVVKPALEAPLAVLAVGDLAAEAGFPDGTVNVLPGGAEEGARLVEHDRTDVITFTGSVETGSEVAAAAGRQLKPVNPELGGKAANVVFPDARIESAVRNAMHAIFVNAGQMCTAGSRLLLHESIHEEFVERLVERVEAMTVGPGLEDPDMGPVVSADQLATVEGYVQEGLDAGATLATGGGTPDGVDPAGHFIEPTVFDDVRPGMSIAREEIFGPVLSVLTFADESEAVEIANDVEYGLYRAVWTADVGRAHRMIEGMDAGTVAVNQYHVNYAQVPFGGWKRSGFKPERGTDAIDSYTRVKNALVNYHRKGG